jgi:hypothetical protein
LDVQSLAPPADASVNTTDKPCDLKTTVENTSEKIDAVSVNTDS